MSILEIVVPDVGTDGEVEVIELMVAVGDNLAVDDPIVVLESDKASIEVPSTAAGKVAELSVSVGDKVKLGDLLMKVEGAAEDGGSEPPAATETAESTAEVEAAPAPAEAPAPAASSSGASQETKILVPDIGGAEAVEVIELEVAEGDQVEVDQTLLVLESDKATMDIPAAAAGKILSLSVKVGDKVSEGDLIGVLLSGGAAAPSEPAPAPAQTAPAAAEKAPAAPAPKAAPSAPASTQSAAPSSEANVHAGPAVRKMARELGADLTQVKATGPRNRILKEDLEAYIKSQVQAAQSGAVGQSSFAAPPLPDFSKFGKVEARPLDKVQLVTAQNMQSSWSNVPHVTQFDEADITDLETFRKSKKLEAEKRGVKLTPLPFMIKACAFALKRMPQFNVSLDLANKQMIQKHYVNIGIAVDTPHGLMVPVVKDADSKSMWQIAQELGELAEKAQTRKLMPADMQGACFTISSLGSIGGTAFTPIVNQPEVAILGVSKAQMKPQYDGQGFVPRLMLPLSLSYDHRALNGADAARFTALLGQVLGDIRELLLD